MKKNIHILILLFFAVSCEKYPDSRFDSNFFNYTILGNNQTADAGNYLNEEVGIQITPNSSVINNEFRFKVEMEVFEGGGIIDKHTFETAGNEPLTTRWKLGADGNNQIILGKIYNTKGQLYSTFEIKATAYLFDRANTIKSGYLTTIMDMVSDTVNHRSMMLSGSKIYVNTDKFYTWKLLTENPRIYIMEINSKGVVYGARSNGELYKSSDWGQTWEYVSNPIPDNYELTITSDDYIWASKWNYGIYCSKDDGLTWQNDTTGLAIKEQLGRVYKLNNGSHLALSQNKLKILQTFDDGITWELINTPESSLSMYVTSSNEIIAYNQEGGFSIHKSSDFGLSFKKVLTGSVPSSMWPMAFTFGNHKNNNFFLVPVVGIYKTNNFESFEKIVSFGIQRYLFVDHQGNLYANGFYNEPAVIIPANN
jgi:hypothetical protein